MEDGENYDENEAKKRLVSNFPYNQLPNMDPFNIIQIRKCLRYLLEISRIDLFYTNMRAAKYTLEFTTTILLNTDDVYAKDVFVEALGLLKEILLRLSLCNKLHEIVPDLNELFYILSYISDFNIFCTYCSSICEPILVQLLKSIKNNDFVSVDGALTEILENFKKIDANKELAVISEIVLLRFPLESKAYKLSAFWLMEDSVKILKNAEVKNNEDESRRIIIIMRNIYTFFMKVSRSAIAPSEMTKYQDSIVQFVEDLMELAPKLIYFTGTDNIRAEAGQLLGLVIHEFLRKQGIISHDVTLTVKEDIGQLPADIKDWPRCFSKTFFWMCHLLYYHKSAVWSSGDVCDAISRLLYSKKYERALTVEVLKSVCYIYPFLLLGHTKIRKCRIIGDDLLMILTRFVPLIDKILSVSRYQLLWIMFKGPRNIKLATVKFWLERPRQENLSFLKESLIVTRSERLLLDVLLMTDFRRDSGNFSAGLEAVGLIQTLHCTALTKELPSLITRVSGNTEVVLALIEACCDGPPQDQNTALQLFNTIHDITIRNPKDDVLVTVFRCIGNLMTAFKSDKEFVNYVCSNYFWVRFPVSRIKNGKNDSLTIAVLEMLSKMLKYQVKPCNASLDPIYIDLAPLLAKSTEVVGKTVNFLSQLLKTTTPIKLKDECVLVVLSKLCGLTEDGYLSPKSYGCLIGLMKLFPAELINSPLLGMLIEKRCRFSSRKRRSSVALKFVLFWIRLMFMNPHKSFCYLPQEGLLTTFLNRSRELREVTLNRYLSFVTAIYQEDDDDFCDHELPIYFNSSMNLQ